MTYDEFKPGDVVRLPSGGPDMTVEGFTGGRYDPRDRTYRDRETICVWFQREAIESEHWSLQRAQFSPGVLEKA
jgi:uncharacterized protein YodC (DUF2158 family)